MGCAISELLKNKSTDWKICIKFAADTRDSHDTAICVFSFYVYIV